MKNLEDLKNSLERSLLETLGFYRGLILDMIEQELEQDNRWPFLRGRLLKALGDRGLAGRLLAVLDDELKN